MVLESLAIPDVQGGRSSGGLGARRNDVSNATQKGLQMVG
jgi:hypothetical protein